MDEALFKGMVNAQFVVETLCARAASLVSRKPRPLCLLFYTYFRPDRFHFDDAIFIRNQFPSTFYINRFYFRLTTIDVLLATNNHIIRDQSQRLI